MMRFAVSLSFIILLGTTLAVKQTANFDTSGRIVNGGNATLGQFPWHAAVNLYHTTDYPNSWLCGGSIISEEWVLTSAHCLDTAETASLYLGSVEPDKFIPGIVGSTEFILHEEYNASTLENNIGLIKLLIKIGFNELVAPIALSSDQLEGGEEVTVSGFGLTSGDNYSPEILNYMTVATITNSECAQVYGDAIFDEMVCISAGSEPFKGACYENTGSPAVLNADTDPLLVGISSFLGGTECEAGNLSGFTRISYYRDWIKDKTGV